MQEEYNRKSLALEYLKHCDEQTVCMAYMYAKHYCSNGVDIREMQTATQCAEALDLAYIRGVHEGIEIAKKMLDK